VAAVPDVILPIDAETETVSSTIQVRERPEDVAVGAGSVWVANSDGTVTRIDTKTREVVATIDLGVSPGGIAFGAGMVWVTGYAPLRAGGT
jgi:virginiamycin B lyase